MFCESCNLKVSNTIRICPKCGHKHFSETKKEINSQPSSSNKSAANSKRHNPSIKQVRPWVRYWARTIDITLFTIFIFFTYYYFLFPSYSENLVLIGLLNIPLWIFGEAFCLANFGTTPGKKLLKISIKHKNDKQILFEKAVNRSMKMAWRGQALGFPIVTFFTHIVAYHNLKKNESTSWDSEEKFIVTHENIGLERIALIIFLSIFIVFLIGIWLERF